MIYVPIKEGFSISESLQKRQHDRKNARFRVNFVGDGAFFSDYSYDISEGGIRVGSINPLKTGTKLKLALYIPGRPSPVKVEGEVVWSKLLKDKDEEYLGIGVKFSELDPLSKEVIRTALKELPRKLT